MGVQASGKSSFCRQTFFDSHVRINLDMLRTRHRERLLITACSEGRQSYVVDNTNPASADRVNYIKTAKAAGFRVVGYYFRSTIDDCKTRNSQRPPGKVIPLRGLLGTYRRLELPSYDEGFDQLFYVSADAGMSFQVSEWTDEI